MKKPLPLFTKTAFIAGVLTVSIATPFLASAQVAPSSTAASTITLALGDSGVAVAVLQRLLINDHYLSLSAPTGISVRLRKAPSKFSKRLTICLKPGSSR